MRPTRHHGAWLPAVLAAGCICLMCLMGATSPAHAQVGQVNGTVTGKDGRPVTGAAVALIPQETPTLYGTTTGEDGRYAFSGLPTDAFSVVVITPHGALSRKDGIRVRALFRSIVDFDMTQIAPETTVPSPPAGADTGAGTTSTIVCRVQGAARQPVPDALVWVFPVGEAGSAQRIRTNPDGECRVEAIPPGTYRLLVIAPGFVTWELGPVAMVEPGQRSLLLSLQPFPMGFDGRLIDMLVPMEPIAPEAP